MPNPEWIVFDTSVYIAAIRGGLPSTDYQLLQKNLPRTYLCSVVSAELRAGVIHEGARRAVNEFSRRAQRVGRMVTPSREAWDRAGDLLAEMWRSEPRLRTKVSQLWNDALIALCARQLGAALVTRDAEDYELLRRYLVFRLRPVG